ncbi:hypothetical protein S245_057611 [Arachis hypogaea]
MGRKKVKKETKKDPRFSITQIHSPFFSIFARLNNNNLLQFFILHVTNFLFSLSLSLSLSLSPRFHFHFLSFTSMLLSLSTFSQSCVTSDLANFSQSPPP